MDAHNVATFKFFQSLPSHDAATVFYVRVDPEIARTKELLTALYYTLWLPGYFGFNWDALLDCLRDLSWMPCRKTVLVHSALPGLPQADLQTYLAVLREALASWHDQPDAGLEVYFSDRDRQAVTALLSGADAGARF